MNMYRSKSSSYATFKRFFTIAHSQRPYLLILLSKLLILHIRLVYECLYILRVCLSYVYDVHVYYIKCLERVCNYTDTHIHIIHTIYTLYIYPTCLQLSFFNCNIFDVSKYVSYTHVYIYMIIYYEQKDIEPDALMSILATAFQYAQSQLTLINCSNDTSASTLLQVNTHTYII